MTALPPKVTVRPSWNMFACAPGSSATPSEARYPMGLPRLFARVLVRHRMKNPTAQNLLAALESRRSRFFLDPTLVAQEALAYGDDPQMTNGPSLQLVSPAVPRRVGQGRRSLRGHEQGHFKLAKGSVKGMAAFAAAAQRVAFVCRPAPTSSFPGSCPASACTASLSCWPALVSRLLSDSRLHGCRRTDCA